VDFTAIWETWGAMFQAEHGSTLSPDEEDQFTTAFGGRLDAEAAIYRGFAQARQATMRQYTAILTLRDRLIASVEAHLADWDALLCPVTMGPAFAHCPAGTPISVDGRTVPYWVALVSYTCPFNVTGHPAVVVPLTRTREGLPIGLQIVGRRWSDMSLLAVAATLAQVIGPAPRPPRF
jgi:amidase